MYFTKHELEKMINSRLKTSDLSAYLQKYDDEVNANKAKFDSIDFTIDQNKSRCTQALESIKKCVFQDKFTEQLNLVYK